VTALTDEHLRAADVLAGCGPDRGGVALPGGLELVRARGRLFLRPVRWPSGV
jgi:tRNA(Ile)-lysidine synthase